MIIVIAILVVLFTMSNCGKRSALSFYGEFKPHMMYHPVTGKGFKANTYEDHIRMSKLGYTH